MSNPVGGEYIGNARWLGTPLAELLDGAGVQASSDQLVSRSIDGFTAGTPTAVVMDGRDAMLAIAMNGEPLPLEHGFPVRMVVPGLYGYVSATKWIVEIELTTFDAFDAYWIKRGWAQQAPIKTQVPDRHAAVGRERPGRHGDGGRRGVGTAPRDLGRRAAGRRRRVDTGGPLGGGHGGHGVAVAYNASTPGQHRLQVRATDRSGTVQAAEHAPPFPDGATGYHEVMVQVH